MKVYVAGAWVEQLQRAKPTIARLQANGVHITFDWTAKEPDRANVNGDAGLPTEERRKYAELDLKGVLDADVVWLLAPSDKGACGSWIEFGAALATRHARIGTSQRPRPLVVVSGEKWKRSIFTELADYTFDSDEEGFEAVLALHHSYERFAAGL